jgi:nuclear transport factor 2 (NTF2) superfamily protein
MSRKRNCNTQDERKVWPEQVIGGKYVRLLEKSLRQLRSEKVHGNRQLFLDDVFVVYLLAFFNPSVRSLRTIEDFSQTVQVEKHLSIRKICKSTLSDFNRLADPERLKPILQTLHDQVNNQQGEKPSQGSDLQALLSQTVAVDGTFLSAVADVTWAIANSNNHGATRHRARLDAFVNVSNWIPEAIVVPAPGESEADSAARHLQAERIYIYDRGYMSFSLLRAHYKDTNDGIDAMSHFVVRFKTAGGNSPTLLDTVDRPLTDEDVAAGIVSDRVGYFTSDTAKREGISEIAVREVIVTYEKDGETKTLRLISNLMDIPATSIAILYRYRWQVELFFRWFKSFGNFRHLISHQRDGVLTHLYVTIIAVMLMYLHTGYRPSKYMFALVGQVAVGAATLDEILPILRERERRSQLDRESAARRRARKKN